MECSCVWMWCVCWGGGREGADNGYNHAAAALFAAMCMCNVSVSLIPSGTDSRAHVIVLKRSVPSPPFTITEKFISIPSFTIEQLFVGAFLRYAFLEPRTILCVQWRSWIDNVHLCSIHKGRISGSVEQLDPSCIYLLMTFDLGLLFSRRCSFSHGTHGCDQDHQQEQGCESGHVCSSQA
jgi:hypothetical protein